VGSVGATGLRHTTSVLTTAPATPTVVYITSSAASVRGRPRKATTIIVIAPVFRELRRDGRGHQAQQEGQRTKVPLLIVRERNADPAASL
jgi:hypothetical protein